MSTPAAAVASSQRAMRSGLITSSVSSGSDESPSVKPGVLTRLRNAFSVGNSINRGRTSSADASSPPQRSKAHVQAAKLAKLRAYANGNVSSVDLSGLPPLPMSAQSSLSSSSSSAHRSHDLGGFVKLSPIFSSSPPPSQRSPLSNSQSPSGTSSSQNSPEVRKAHQEPTVGVRFSAWTHRKATKSTASLPGWLSAPFNTRSLRPDPDQPSTPTNSPQPALLKADFEDNETPKQKKRRAQTAAVRLSDADGSVSSRTVVVADEAEQISSIRCCKFQRRRSARAWTT